MKVKKSKTVPPSPRPSWEDLLDVGGADGVLKDFRDMGGDLRFLRHLWNRYEMMDSCGSMEVANKDWLEVRGLAQRLYKAMQRPPQNSIAFEDRGLYAGAFRAVNFLRRFAKSQARIRERPGTKVSSHERHYWCAALLPYFDHAEVREGRWLWLARWFDLLGCGVHSRTDSSSIQESLRKWWKTRAMNPVKSLVRRKRSSEGGHSTIKAGLPSFDAAFEYVFWKWPPVKDKLTWDSKEVQAYRALVLRQMPFLENLGW